MAITINGTANTVAGLAVGGVPDGSIDRDAVAADLIDGTKIADDAVAAEHVADDAVGVAQLSASGTASSSTFLRGDNAWAAAGGGKVNQIVQYTDNANRDLGTTGSWTQIPSMEKAITTTDNSSKVLVQHMGVMYQDSTDLTAGITVYKDSTELSSSGYGFNAFYGNNNDVAWNIFIHYLDTPGNAGTYTYKIYYKTDKSDGHYNQWEGRITTSVITLTEILP